MFKYITIHNEAFDPDNITTQRPINDFLGGFTEFGLPNTLEDANYLTEQFQKIIRAAVACNVKVIGFGFLSQHTHSDIYRIVRYAGLPRSAGFLADFTDVGSGRVASGESISMRIKSMPDDSKLFNGYYFDTYEGI